MHRATMRASALAAGALFALSACQRGPAPAPRDSGEPLDAVKMALPAPAATPAPPPSGEKPEWRTLPDGGAGFGYAGQRPELSLSCRSGLVVVTRNVAAPVGAQALFALIGNGRILRLPVDAIADPAGSGGYVWRGSFAPDDPASDVFMGADLTGTLPGGGEITMTGSPVEHAVIEHCRTRPAATAAPTSTGEPD